MMATAGPPSSSSFLPLLESLEDSAAGQSEQTDAYLTIANRLSGEEGRQFLPAVEKHFPRLGKAILAHITSPNVELSQAALQTLGFCVYHSHIVSAVPETFAAEMLSALCLLVVKSADKNTCTRALWVISKQSFPPDTVAGKVPLILGSLESVWNREDLQSVVMEHEALNVVIRLLEQVPAQMGEGAVQWAKLIIPLVVHSASKVRLRAAAAMEMGMPLLLEKQAEIATVIEPMMSSKLIPELQKLFMSKNETNVLKLWPLFVKLLGKLLHRGGPFINSLLHLEELGFRSSSPTIKKIAFIAWKSLIDNFALNPDILCSAKRMKLLMQPLTSINVRTEALLLTKVEVWWYLVVQLGPNLSSNFDQVSVPLLQSTIRSDSPSIPGTPSRAAAQNGAPTPGTPKTVTQGFNSPANTPRISLNSSIQVPSTFPSIQLLGLEMLLHYFLGPDAVAAAAKIKLTLNLEPLKHPLISGASSFTKHATVLISSVRDGFTNIGKDAADSLLAVLWTSLTRFVNLTIETGSKKDRQGCEVLTLMLQALQSIVTSEALPAGKVLVLFEATVKGIPQRVLGSASYQVGKMDVLNGTPALFLILLLYNSSMLSAYIEDERFFQCLQTLVGCGLSGPTSPLAFAEAVLGAIRRSAGSLQNKEQLWRMWSVMVSSLTDTITQSNEVNQGDALEHNFSAMHSALLFPVTHLLPGTPLQQVAQKSMLSTWSKLYKVFARCSALVVTAEENICCEELCAKMTASVDKDALKVPSTLNAVASILHVVVECVDFSPYTPQFQQKLKSPHTPVNWMRKRNKVLGNLSTFQSLLVQCLEVYLEDPEGSPEATGVALVSVLSALFTNLVLSNAVQETLTSLIQLLTLFYKQAGIEPPKFTWQVLAKLEKLLIEILGCLQSRSALAYNDELLALLSPLLCVLFLHKSKQLRTSVTHFWNATFANSVSLAYPDEIRPVLSQVKQKTPIILPGFEVVTVSDELSGPYSSESSQLETKLSGMPVSSVGKRDSLLGKAADLKDRSSSKTSKPVSTKLDFGSPKPPRREVLEEEASVDFVFIPPEMKERVLTEHQKEIKRTKRVDIPAMYNNLDASMDTTVFTQYTQSQEDSFDKVPVEPADMATEEAPARKNSSGACLPVLILPTQVPQEDMKNEEDLEILTKDTQDYASPKVVEDMTDDYQEEMVPESRDVSMEDDSKSDGKAGNLQSTEGTSPDMSGSSDLVSGTPQKPSSRRQSFITLEKYVEGKPASPSSSSTFTGPLIKTSNSQERSNINKRPSSQASQTSTGLNSQGSPSTLTGKNRPQHSVNNAPESPQRPKGSGMKNEPVRLIERLHSNTADDDDVIPDTQTEDERKESTKMSQEEESDTTLDDSQTSPSEPRRSGRHRVRPLLPGEDPEERKEKYAQFKRRRSGAEPTNDSPKSDSTQSRPNTRSKHAAEEDSGRERLRTRAQRDRSESSQTSSEGRARKKIKLFSTSDHFLDKVQAKKRSTRESSQTDLQSDSHSDSHSDYESQSQGRRSRQSRTSVEIREEDRLKKKVLLEKESSQTSTQEAEKGKEVKDSKLVTPSPQKTNQRRKDSQMITSSPEDNQEQEDSQIITPSPEKDNQLKEDSKIIMSFEDKQPQDSQIITSSLEKDNQPPEDSHFITSSPEKDNPPPEESQIITSPEKNEFKTDTQIITSAATSKSQELKPLEQSENDKTKKPSQIVASSQIDDKSQESESVEKNPKVKGDCLSVTTFQTNQGSQDTSMTSELNEELITDERNTEKEMEDDLSQEASQVVTPSSSESQSLRRSRRSKASSETEPQDKSDGKHSLGRQTRSNSQTTPTAEARGRTRRSKVHEELSKSSPRPTMETSQSLNVAGSAESQVRGRYSKRRSSQVASVEMSESESSETRESSPALQRRGRKARASLQSPLTLESKDDKMTDTQRFEAKNTDLANSPKSQDLQNPESFQVTDTSKEESLLEVDAVESLEPVAPEKMETDDRTVRRTEQRQDSDKTSSQPCVSRNEDIQDKLLSDIPEASAADMLDSPGENFEIVQISESSEEKAENVSADETLNADSKHAVAPVEEAAPGLGSFSQNQIESPDPNTELSKEDKESVSDQCAEEITSLQESDEHVNTHILNRQDEAENNEVTNLETALTDNCDTSVFAESTGICHDSPAKLKDLDAVLGPDVGQSPISGRTRGTWSPSASPSTSILKKGQKRPLEEESLSPLVKSRRVSFADPIHQQETADDIDRRSPAVRTSSPRRSRVGGLPQPKYVTTPTKGLVILSPRNLHSPGYKSSKKCLISEMSQEPRPVSRDCIYPALVGCSAPVEAVLPQISSNMWSRGFGQLVRARNIKTVGDLSALTPSELKTLPVRSPKVPNVKKALKIYEQQRKGRGGDELKSFDETEMMTSEQEEAGTPSNPEEEKISGETLATELADEPVSADRNLEDDGSSRPGAQPLSAEQPAESQLPSEVEALTCRMTPLQLSRCSPQQLLQLHDQLAGMTRRVVVELQTRLCQTDGKP